MYEAKGADDETPLETTGSVDAGELESSQPQSSAVTTEIDDVNDRSMEHHLCRGWAQGARKKRNKIDGETLDMRHVMVGRQTLHPRTRYFGSKIFQLSSNSRARQSMDLYEAQKSLP